jgi:hypothetical protein
MQQVHTVGMGSHSAQAGKQMPVVIDNQAASCRQMDEGSTRPRIVAPV